MGSPGILCSSRGEFLAFRTGIPGGPAVAGQKMNYGSVRPNAGRTKADTLGQSNV